MIVTTEEERSLLRITGKKLRAVLDDLIAACVPGAVAADLDALAQKRIEQEGGTPSFLNYTPAGSKKAFPAAICVSVNDEVVHGIPHKDKVLADGDLVTIDCGLTYKGMFVDAACTTVVGTCTPEAGELVEATRKALGFALLFAHTGAKTGALGSAVEETAAEYGFCAPPDLGGHGVGASPHEDPFIPNIGGIQGEPLQQGHVIAIEPILFSGSDPRTVVDKDGFTIRTIDGSLAAHFEHTVLVSGEGTPELITGALW